MVERLGEALLDLSTSDKGFNQGIRQAQTRAEGLGQALDTVAARSQAVGTALVAGAGRAGGAVQLTTQQLANMQFQLQDIAVGLASGQSPFTVIAQQGSQIAQSFRQGTTVLQALRAVGQGLTTFLLNPLNLAVVGFGLAATAASALFSTIFDSGEDAEKRIKKQEEAVRALDEALVGTIPQLREFIKEQERLGLIQAAETSFEVLRANQIDPLREAVRDLQVEFADTVLLLQDFGAETEVLSELQSAFDRATEAAAEGKDASEDFARAQQIVFELIEQTGLPSLASFQISLNGVAERARAAAAAIAGLGSQQEALGSNPAATGVIRGLEQEIDA
ncbi:phage tail length tape measure family protein, partial [Stappia sp. F7233]